MSKRAKKELVLRMQEDYIGERDSRKKARILDTVCRATGFERKYAIKRLRGTRPYKARPVRGKTKKPNGKGHAYRHDKPKTPCDRVLEKRSAGRRNRLFRHPAPGSCRVSRF